MVYNNVFVGNKYYQEAGRGDNGVRERRAYEPFQPVPRVIVRLPVFFAERVHKLVTDRHVNYRYDQRPDAQADVRVNISDQYYYYQRICGPGDDKGHKVAKQARSHAFGVCRYVFHHGLCHLPVLLF